MNVLFFGCEGQCGHFLRDKLDGQRRYGSTPWKNDLDTGLLQEPEEEGQVFFHQKDGWTAIAWWDRSGPDKRPGCNTAFLVAELVPAEVLLAEAKIQWSGIFSRAHFQIRLPVLTA